MLYIVWNNGGPQAAMGYWLKSFNKTPAPVPGVTFTVSQINTRTSRAPKTPRYSSRFIPITVPLTTTGLFICVAFVWGWLSDACRGSRWPFIYAGAVLTVSYEPFARLFLFGALADRYSPPFSLSSAFSCARCRCTRTFTAAKLSIGSVSSEYACSSPV